MRLQLVCQLLVLLFWAYGCWVNLKSDHRYRRTAADVSVTFLVMIALLLIFVGSGAFSLIWPRIIDPLLTR